MGAKIGYQLLAFLIDIILVKYLVINKRSNMPAATSTVGAATVLYKVVCVHFVSGDIATLSPSVGFEYCATPGEAC